MEKSLFSFIWRYSARQQLVILLITVIAYPVTYALLELPKLIVNDAIQGENFPREVASVEFDQISYLVLLCLTFLGLVVASNGIKLALNVYKGRLGERMLRRLRFELFQRVLRFRLPHFKKVSSGEIIPMITSEVEDVGGFIGEAVALPAYQGGMLVVQIGFIFMQDPLLGLAAVSSYPMQAYIIPKLQRKVILLSRKRVRNVRVIADKIGESIGGVAEIHANDASAWHSADLSERLYTNYKIRFKIFNWKYFIKFLNNFMNQLTPFLFYLIGGWLVIEGNLSLGALLAVIAAYKDLAGPWKELLAYYQMVADVDVKYQTVVENFDPADIYPVARLTDDGNGDPLAGDLVMRNASFSGGAAGQEVFEVSPEGGRGHACRGDRGRRVRSLRGVATGRRSSRCDQRPGRDRRAQSRHLERGGAWTPDRLCRLVRACVDRHRARQRALRPAPSPLARPRAGGRGEERARPPARRGPRHPEPRPRHRGGMGGPGRGRLRGRGRSRRPRAGTDRGDGTCRRRFPHGAAIADRPRPASGICRTRACRAPGPCRPGGGRWPAGGDGGAVAHRPLQQFCERRGKPAVRGSFRPCRRHRHAGRRCRRSGGAEGNQAL